MILQTYLSALIQSFRKKGFDEPMMEAELLVSAILGWRRSELVSRDQAELDQKTSDRLNEAADRRLQGEPLAYILGKKDFYKSSFFVGPGVLIPRPETEMLVEGALNKLTGGHSYLVADFGAGSGCIGISILLELAQVEVVFVEKSEQALHYLKKNLSTHSVANRAQAVNQSVESFSWERPFDLIAANPPYIALNDPHVMPEVHGFEPHEALYSDEEGLRDIKIWAKKAAMLLKPGGGLLMEIGADQSEKLKSEPWQEWGFSELKFHRDLSGLNRMVDARRSHVSIIKKAESGG